MRHKLAAIFAALLSTIGIFPTARAEGAEFSAAVGRIGLSNCYGDSCAFFIIDSSVRVGSNANGVLFAILSRQWLVDLHENPAGGEEPVFTETNRTVGQKTLQLDMVFCSLTKPVLFRLQGIRWQATALRPGDERAANKDNEAMYQRYFASCHKSTAKDPISRALALRLGYKFVHEPTKGSDVSEDDTRQPMDMLK